MGLIDCSEDTIFMTVGQTRELPLVGESKRGLDKSKNDQFEEKKIKKNLIEYFKLSKIKFG
jgi:hypothetical protein